MSAAPVSLPTHARGTAPVTASGAEVTHLRRLRWAVRAVLTLGVAASIAANVLHARPNLISQLIAAWPPLALLLTVELISRVPAHRRALAVLRLLAAAVIAGIAAWVSYWHMTGVAARYGETDAAASYLLPVSVDGLVVVASISLVEIAGRIRAATDHETAASLEVRPAVDALPAARGDSPGTPASQVEQPVGGQARHPAGDGTDGRAGPETSRRESEPAYTRLPVESDGDLAMAPFSSDGDENARDPQPGDADLSASDDGPVPSNTADAVAYWYERDPGLHPAEIGAKIGRSERTVRRYWPGPPQRPAATANGETVHHLVETARAR